MKEEQLIESRQLRDKMSGKYEVLEKVKQLLLLPDTDMMSIEQVSNYYEVSDRWIKELYGNNREEIDSDGTKILPRNFYNGSEVKPTSVNKKQTSVTYTFDDGQTVTINNRGLKAFSRRAVLRIGMMLQQSDVAREVRTQLLNIEEKTSTETKTEDIDTEQSLMMSVGMAVASGDATAVAIATAKMIEFKNRHIAKLEQDNKALASGNLEWSDRSTINFAIRKLSGISGVRIQDLWSDLYQQLLYKHHINVKARGKQPWIQHVKESEWKSVNMVFASMCIAYGTTASEVLDQLKVK